MTTLSIPVSEKLLKAINDLIQDGVASNKAEFVRRAIQQFVDQKVVEMVLRASKEPRLEGDLDELASKL